LVFPVPVILNASPRLLGYYRLLYGYSQKEFYTTATGLGSFQSMEKSGTLTVSNGEKLEEMCKALAQAGELLLQGIGTKRISPATLHDLTLLTLGPQLRGGANVKRGAVGIQAVFKVIEDIVGTSEPSMGTQEIEIVNAAGRTVLIQFASDPDIVIQEKMPTDFRKLIAIEVKGGMDFSNIHNRIGEAEKSHQKAKRNGFVECWTVVNVDKFDAAIAKHESPTTNRFYRIADLVSGKGDAYQDFRDRIISLTGIKD